MLRKLRQFFRLFRNIAAGNAGIADVPVENHGDENHTQGDEDDRADNTLFEVGSFHLRQIIQCECEVGHYRPSGQVWATV